MRIGYDAKRAFHNFSGLGNYSRNVISLMSSHYPANDYLLYTPSPRQDVPLFLPEQAVIRTPENLFSRTFSSYWRSVLLAGIAAKDRLDIFHGLSNELPVRISGTGIRSVVTIHDLIFMRFPELYHRIDRTIYRQKINHAVKVADRIIAASEQTKRDIIRYTQTKPEKISVVYQSCDPAFRAPPGETVLTGTRKKYRLPDNYILYVGTIEKRKNLLNLVMALRKSGSDLPLIVIGRETDYAARVHAYIEKHQMTNISFLQNVPSTDLPALYAMAMIFVYPSSFEGFGIPVLEAITSGVPVIAGKGHCLEETGGPGSVYVDPGDITALAGAIIELAGNEEQRKRMAAEGRRFSEQFSEENTTRELNKVYESVV